MLDTITLHNIAETEPANDGTGWQFYRLPVSLLPELNENARHRATWSSGSELRFNLQENAVTLQLQIVEEPAPVEVYFGSFYHSWHIIQTSPTDLTVQLPERLRNYPAFRERYLSEFDPFLCRVMLPWKGRVILHSIEGAITPCQGDQIPRHTLLAYGSSITHGNASIRPTGSYAAQLARRLNMNLLNLGFGAGAHFEKDMATYIANRPDWDVCLLEAGINMVEWCPPDEFEARIRQFLSIITTAHPDKLIFVTDLLPYFDDLDTTEDRNRIFRQIVRDVMTDYANKSVVYIKAANLLSDFTGLASDLLHPSPSGMEEIAAHLSSQMIPHTSHFHKRNDT